MNDFQSFLDDTLSSIKMNQNVEDKIYEDYNIYEEISTQISLIRGTARITQKELAVKCGLTQVNISNIENGVSKPTIDSLKKNSRCIGEKIANRI